MCHKTLGHMWHPPLFTKAIIDIDFKPRYNASRIAYEQYQAGNY